MHYPDKMFRNTVKSVIYHRTHFITGVRNITLNLIVIEQVHPDRLGDICPINIVIYNDMEFITNIPAPAYSTIPFYQNQLKTSINYFINSLKFALVFNPDKFISLGSL